MVGWLGSDEGRSNTRGTHRESVATSETHVVGETTQTQGQSRWVWQSKMLLHRVPVVVSAESRRLWGVGVNDVGNDCLLIRVELCWHRG